MVLFDVYDRLGVVFFFVMKYVDKSWEDYFMRDMFIKLEIMEYNFKIFNDYIFECFLSCNERKVWKLENCFMFSCF